jgi:hypothetical protein
VPIGWKRLEVFSLNREEVRAEKGRLLVDPVNVSSVLGVVVLFISSVVVVAVLFLFLCAD